MGFPLDDNFVFGDNFFSWLIIFFSPKATKKITQPRKKITHQQTKLLIQRKHHYIYDITFLCPPLFLAQNREKKSGGTTKKLLGVPQKNYGEKLSRLKNIITFKKRAIPFRIFLGRDNILSVVIIFF